MGESMKKIILAVTLLFTVAMAYGQSPVKWSYKVQKIKDKIYEIHLEAFMDNEWHIYSQTTPEGGPIPTAFSFSKNPLVIFEGNIKEVGKLEEHFEPLFGVKVKQYSDKVEFIQTIKLKATVKTAVNGYIEFMACNDAECMPPAKQAFSVNVD